MNDHLYSKLFGNVISIYYEKERLTGGVVSVVVEQQTTVVDGFGPVKQSFLLD